ncbi:MAG: hypothetical protein WCX65_11430 [bacterium]
MRYKATHALKGTLDEVLEIVMDRSRDPEVYTNITSNRRTRWEECGDKIHCEYLVCGNGDIPKPLRLIAAPHMFTWRETGHWDMPGHAYHYRLKPFYFANIFKAWGIIRFSENGPESVIRELEGEVRIELPLVGPLASRTIVGYMLGNYEKEAHEFDKYLMRLRETRKSCD